MTERKDQRPAARSWSEIDAMSEKELRAEMIEAGSDPDAFLASMGKLARGMRAKFAPRIEQEDGFFRAVTAAFPAYAETVAAGMPAGLDEAAAPPERLSLLDVLRGASPEDAMWARVSGWSMRDEGIKDGDMILVNTKREARSGDIVLAHLQGHGQLVKKLRVERGRAVLASANPDFADIVVEDATQLRIHGVVVGRAGSV